MGVNTTFSCYLKELYTGDDLSKIDGVETDDDKKNATNTDFLNGVDDFLNFTQNLAKNPLGTICTGFLKLFIAIFDAIQIIVNTIQTFTLHTASDLTLEYDYIFLETDKQNSEYAQNNPDYEADDKSAGNRDMYTNVGEYVSKDYVSYDGQKHIYVDGNKKGFTKDTKIPVIPIDVYNLAVGDISFLDVNFLKVNQQLHTEDNSPWMILRNIGVTIIKITMYLVAAFLITTLIWHGINLVRGSIDNPQAQVEHKKALNRFFISLLMLVGSVVIMALSIFASNMFLDDLKSDTNELPIRVNVSFSSDSSSTEGYSFSTNFTGYVRYMAQISDVDMYVEKAVYTLQYMILVIVNAIGGLAMVFRMVIMLLLAILGPIIAGLHALNKGDNRILNYKTWAELYITLASVQIFIAIAARIVLECFEVN